MIRNGIPINEIETYLHARAWLTDAARLLGRTPEELAAELTHTYKWCLTYIDGCWIHL